MATPIYDFLKKYSDSNGVRMHMPGHKGKGALGIEALDLTEIRGADSLYEPEGIIRDSEERASRLFGCTTFYSTEGSSLSIKAMLYLALRGKRADGARPLVLAARNAHRAFISAACLVDFDVEWIDSTGSGYLCCPLSAQDIRRTLIKMKRKPDAVYLTSPDYLGNTVNIREISDTCHDFGVLLLVDNAHGAYLRFLDESLHPIDLGADMCADSAHKTLPVLTGGAYLHFGKGISAETIAHAKEAMLLFGSTSPSYLTLASLDLCNGYLEREIRDELRDTVAEISKAKLRLAEHGFTLTGDEPLKITVLPSSFGYTGVQLGKILEDEGVYPEFYDRDSLVLMPSPRGEEGLDRTVDILTKIPKKTQKSAHAPRVTIPKRVMSPRQAMMCESEILPAGECVGRVAAEVCVGCPPAVPIVVSGEEITKDVVRAAEYYGIHKLYVTK